MVACLALAKETILGVAPTRPGDSALCGGGSTTVVSQQQSCLLDGLDDSIDLVESI